MSESPSNNRDSPHSDHIEIGFTGGRNEAPSDRNEAPHDNDSPSYLSTIRSEIGGIFSNREEVRELYDEDEVAYQRRGSRYVIEEQEPFLPNEADDDQIYNDEKQNNIQGGYQDEVEEEIERSEDTGSSEEGFVVETPPQDYTLQYNRSVRTAPFIPPRHISPVHSEYSDKKSVISQVCAVWLLVFKFLSGCFI